MNRDETVKDMAKILCPKGTANCEKCSKSYKCDVKFSQLAQLVDGGCQLVGDDEVVLKKDDYKELKKYRTDWLNSEKMHLQAELEDTEFELGCSNRLFQKVCEEKKELEKQLEQAKQETRAVLQEIKQKYGKSCSEYYPEWIEFSSVQLSKLAKEHGIELE